jgi:hypothetical protein
LGSGFVALKRSLADGIVEVTTYIGAERVNTDGVVMQAIHVV